MYKQQKGIAYQAVPFLLLVSDKILRKTVGVK